MRKMLGCLSLLIMLVQYFFVQVQPGNAGELNDFEKGYVKEKKTIVFVSQTHYPPFEFIGQDGDHTGMCIDLARWISTEFGFKAQFTDTSFQNAQENLSAGRADVLTSFFYSKKRDENFAFTKMMFEVPASIFVAAERPDIKDVVDLEGKVIAMQAGDYAKEFLDSKNISCTFKYTTNFAEAIGRVIAGEADAVIGDEQIVLYHIFSNNLTKQVKQVGKPLYIGQNCMGLKESDTVLRDIITKGIMLAEKKGVLDQIYKKWLGIRYTPTPSWMQQIFPYMTFTACLVIVISFMVWGWNMKLRKTVAMRTDALSKSEKTLRTILEASPLGIGLSQGRIIKWYNPAMSRMLGYGKDELIGESIDNIYLNKKIPPQNDILFKKAIQEKVHTKFETEWVRKNGSSFDCRVQFAPLELNEKIMIIAIADDITQQKQTENRIKASLKEKETLLKEIHHRVKNNMQVVSSLLSLQAEEIEEDNVLSVFSDSRNRVQSISMVHEILYQSDNLSEIRLQIYLENLTGYLKSVYAAPGKMVHIHINVGEIVLKMDQAVPFGLIATELLTNSFKYGALENNPLEIEISACLDEKQIIVVFTDNGPGLPPDFNFKTVKTLGLKLVAGLITDQLEGSIDLNNGPGARWVISWPDDQQQHAG